MSKLVCFVLQRAPSPARLSEWCFVIPVNKILVYYIVFEVNTAVTMKNAVFWDIKTQFVPHRRHIRSLLQSTACYCCVRLEIFMAVTINNTVFWDMRTQFLPLKKHNSCPLQSPAG
jgi:hypothetical protein